MQQTPTGRQREAAVWSCAIRACNHRSQARRVGSCGISCRVKPISIWFGEVKLFRIGQLRLRGASEQKIDQTHNNPNGY